MSPRKNADSTQSHVAVDGPDGTVPPDQEPEDILREFQEKSGTDCDLVTSATITEVTEHELQLRIDREITAVESQRKTTVSYPTYNGGLGRRVPYEKRYSKIPTVVKDLYDRLDDPNVGWVDAEETSKLGFRENSGCSPRTCKRCSGSGRKDCTNCDARGRESCPRCSSSSAGRGKVNCSSCGGDGTVECGNCNRWGEVRNADGDKEQCPKCGGKADWPCDHCSGNGTQPCPNHCDNGKITCRTCGGSQKVDCGKCDTSGKVVRVTEGDITYQFTETMYTDSNSPVDPSLLLATEMECVSVEGDVKSIPGKEELLDSDGNPRSTPTPVADVTLHLKAPMLQITYTVGGKSFELYKVGDLIFFDRIPSANPGKIRAITIGTTIALALGTVLLFWGNQIMAFAPGVVG